MKWNVIMIKMIVLSLAMTTLSACSKSENTQNNNINKRWYTEAQVTQGKIVFGANCATCHGDKAQSLVSDWKQALPNGKYPAPPLNGTAHAWHHDKAQLLRSINNGGVPLGGTMPPFANKLTDDNKLAAIAYFQSFWPDEIYQRWAKK
jgi:mono/diheme cytochrome c family protein